MPITFNKTDITPKVLDRGNEIILANWPHDKHIILNPNNDISVKILSHPYILINQSILCNCRIKVEIIFLLESLAACHDVDSQLVMYFMVNTAFVNYLDLFDNLTVSLRAQILLKRTTYKKIVPISLPPSELNSKLLTN